MTGWEFIWAGDCLTEFERRRKKFHRFCDQRYRKVSASDYNVAYIVQPIKKGDLSQGIYEIFHEIPYPYRCGDEAVKRGLVKPHCYRLTSDGLIIEEKEAHAMGHCPYYRY